MAASSSSRFGARSCACKTEHISRGVFNDKQQLALRGAEALQAIIDYGGAPDAASIDLLITRCYTWYAAPPDGCCGYRSRVSQASERGAGREIDERHVLVQRVAANCCS